MKKIKMFLFCSIMLLLINVHKAQITEAIKLEIDVTGNPVEGKFQGYNTAGMFTLSTYNSVDDPLHPLTDNYSYQQLLATKPTVLRFPQGGNSKFAKLLGPDPATFTTIAPYNNIYGYGYNIEEIEDYYNGYYNMPLDEDCKHQSGFENDYFQWYNPDININGTYENQEARKHEPYIIQFKRLVNQLEKDLGYQIDIIYTMNIHTATPEYNIEVINYLKKNTDLNGDGDRADPEEIHSGLKVVGVEIGNEENFGCDFANGAGNGDFTLYYNYAEDYIQAVRDIYKDNMKIAVVAAPPGSLKRLNVTTENGGVEINELDACNYTDAYGGNGANFNNWNQALFNFSITDKIEVIGTPNEYYNAWDAIVIHPYVDEDIFQRSTNECENFPAPGNEDEAYAGAYTPSKVFSKFNDDVNAFFEINTYCDDLLPNYSYVGLPGIMDYYADYIYNRRNGDEGNTAYNDDSNIKIWFTEWNFNPKKTDNLCSESTHTRCGDNTLLQGIFVQRWLLEMMRINSGLVDVQYPPAAEDQYINGLVEYATLHNFSNSSTQTNLICEKKGFDKSFTISGTVYDYHGRDWFEDETVAEDWTEINKRICNYPFLFSNPLGWQAFDALVEPKKKHMDNTPLKTDLYLQAFADYQPGDLVRNVYLYFENATSTEYTVSLNNDINFLGCKLVTLFPPETKLCDWKLSDVEPNLVEQWVKANKTWETAGSSELYKYSSYYFDDLDADGDCEVVAEHKPNYHINKVTTFSPNDIDNVIEFPKYSFGVVKIALEKTNIEKAGSNLGYPVNVYPNPTSELVYFDFGSNYDPQADYSIYIFDYMGNRIAQLSANNTSLITYKSTNPGGAYMYKILKDKEIISTGYFVKQ